MARSLAVTRRDVLATGVAVAAACALAYITTVSPQLALTLTLVGLTYAVYVRDRRAGLTLVWTLWLVVPGVRRILGETAYVQTDPLSLAPLMATATAAAVELSRGAIPPLARRVMLLVAAGWLIGVPTGLLAPQAMLYSLSSYLVGVSAFILGWREPRRGAGDLTLVWVVTTLAPALAAYGIAQYVLPLPSWDAAWLHNVDVITFGAPEAGKVRVFASTNAPGILAPVLALALLWYLSRRNAGTATALAGAVVAGALALTYVRAAWLALALAVVAVVLLGRGVRLPRAVVAIGACVLVPLLLSPVSPTAAALVDRADTTTSLNQDTSAQARIATPSQVVPEAVRRPFGHGLGSAGEATRLSADQDLRAPDNGYLSLLYQAGPVGFVLVMIGLIVALAAAVRATRVAPTDRMILLGALGFVLVFMISGDHFYGVIGVVLWYLLGAAASGGARAAPRRSVVALGRPAVEH